MKYFHKVAEGVDTFPLLHATMTQPSLWNENTGRTTHPGTPHTEVEDIWLRFNDLAPYRNSGDLAAIADEHESICYTGWHRLPQARSLIFDLMRRVEGIRLGRVLITRLLPGCTIAPHEDGGSHAAYYERYHVVLKGLPGSLFTTGDETVCMRTGEVWWFDNSVEHSVVNNSAEERVHMIVDIAVAK